MSSPATHEDLSQFLNKFPSGSESSIVISSDIPSPALDEVFSRHQAHYLEKLLQVEKLEPEKWTDDQVLEQKKPVNALGSSLCTGTGIAIPILSSSWVPSSSAISVLTSVLAHVDLMRGDGRYVFCLEYFIRPTSCQLPVLGTRSGRQWDSIGQYRTV